MTYCQQQNTNLLWKTCPYFPGVVEPFFLQRNRRTVWFMLFVCLFIWRIQPQLSPCTFCVRYSHHTALLFLQWKLPDKRQTSSCRKQIYMLCYFHTQINICTCTILNSNTNDIHGNNTWYRGKLYMQNITYQYGIMTIKKNTKRAWTWLLWTSSGLQDGPDYVFFWTSAQLVSQTNCFSSTVHQCQPGCEWAHAHL